jgi:hypothetical protein
LRKFFIFFLLKIQEFLDPQEVDPELPIPSLAF